MTQIPLFRSNDPSTSRDAAARVPAFKAGHEAKIYDALCNAPHGLTYREIAAIAKLEPVAVGRRLKGMERRRLVERRIVNVATDCDPWMLETRAGMCVWRKA